MCELCLETIVFVGLGYKPHCGIRCNTYYFSGADSETHLFVHVSVYNRVFFFVGARANLPMGHPPPVPGAEARRNLFYQELRVGDREVVPECQRGGFLVLILLAVISVLSCWLPRRSA